jgi:hypothetical protein
VVDETAARREPVSALAALADPRLSRQIGNSDNATVLTTLLKSRAQIEERFADAAVAMVELAFPSE